VLERLTLQTPLQHSKSNIHRDPSGVQSSLVPTSGLANANPKKREGRIIESFIVA
jgi:hypothetical protein